jgi:hypothetical protein
MFLVTNINGTRSANSAKNEIFMAFIRIGVGPGVNIESHKEVAIEAMSSKMDEGESIDSSSKGD